MSLLYNPPPGNQQRKRNFRREYELALTKACHIQRVSRIENLHAVFLQHKLKKFPSREHHRVSLGQTARKASEPPGTRSSISSGSVCGVHSDTLDVLEGSRTKQYSPGLPIPHIIFDRERSKRHARIWRRSITKADDGFDADFSHSRVSVSSPLFRSYANSSSSTVASSVGTAVSIRYLIAINTPSEYPQYAHTSGTPYKSSLEYLNTSIIKTDHPKPFFRLPSIDGEQCAKDYIDYLKRSSHHSQWVDEPDQIDHDPPTVLHRISLWATGRVRSGTIHVARALGFPSSPVLSVGADRCYKYYCSLPSCNQGRHR